MAPEAPSINPEAPEPGRVPESAEELERLVRAAGGALSKSTERALRSDLAIFAAWCAERGERPLPAKPETVAAFVDDRAEVRVPATVRRDVTSIGIAHRALGLERAVKSPAVRLALNRMHQRKGRRQDQATGLTWPLRQRLLEAAGERLIDDRNRALLAVAYDAMLRRAELVSLHVDDLLEELQGDGSLLVRGSKTDVEGRGEIVWVSADTVELVRTWLGRAGIVEGILFRSVGKGGRVGERLNPGQVPRIFKAMARQADLPETMAEGLSGHSARVGAAQDMVAAGIEMPASDEAG
ncbi:MAG: tyrosine-type recombinase/integrase, partial [Boseongicola sp. SB0670_bin_30]|nr:tyrosine-type recombinase/integrase [Boseongicola sp. SB0670_bin_30]